MAYKEQNGRVVLEMSPEQYVTFLMVTGTALAAFRGNPKRFQQILQFTNEVNHGNPEFTPYALEDPDGVDLWPPDKPGEPGS